VDDGVRIVVTSEAEFSIDDEFVTAGDAEGGVGHEGFVDGEVDRVKSFNTGGEGGRSPAPVL